MTLNLNSFYVMTALMVLALTIAGCKVVRKATYPPDFSYLEQKTVKSSMQELARSIDKIDRELNMADSKTDTEIRNIIINELNNMKEIANNLGAGTTTTNHLFIDQHIDQFKADVLQARHFIEAEPSNYYLAGKLVGSCVSCHVLRPDQWILMNAD